MGTNISLMSSFIFKLFQVYKTVDQHGTKLMRLITKVSLLCVWSCLPLLGLSITAPLSSAISSVHWRGTTRIFPVLDVYTNFICIYLSFEYSQDYYSKICGWCDLKCFQCWMHCIGDKRKKLTVNQDEEVVSVISEDRPMTTITV